METVAGCPNVVDYLFRPYDTPAVGAVADDFDDASCRLLESLGLAEVGCIRRDRFVDGAHVDTYQYGMFRENWTLERDS